MEPGEPGGPHPHRRVGLDGEARCARLDQDQDRATLEHRAHDEELGLGAARDRGLHPVEDDLLAPALSAGGRLEGVEEDPRLSEGQGCGRDVVPAERREVGLLLLIGPPQAEGGGDRAGRQRRDGEPQVSVAQGLGDQRTGHRGAVREDPAECVRQAQDREPELLPGAQHLRRCRARGVGLRGGGPHHLGGELAGDVEQQLLVLARGQVEDPAGGSGRGAQARGPRGADPLEGAPGGGGRAEAAAGGGEDHALGRAAQAGTVEQVALGETVQRGHGVPDRVA